nr:hypothetical protein QOL21_04165 [Acholeplasma laidlawii]
MGDLTVNFGLASSENNQFELVLNLRYPNGVNYDKDVFEPIANLLPEGFGLDVDHHQKLLYKDPNSTLIKTLMNVYQKHTNDMTPPISIGVVHLQEQQKML